MRTKRPRKSNAPKSAFGRCAHGEISTSGKRTIAASGHRVTLATIDAHSATEIGYPDRMIFHKRLAAQGVDTLPYLKLSALRNDGNRLLATLTHELPTKSKRSQPTKLCWKLAQPPLAEVFLSCATVHQQRHHRCGCNGQLVSATSG